MQSQGIRREPSKKASSAETEQLERSAEMFEMILQSAPDDIQNYLALKDIYRKLKRDADLKRAVKRLAEVYLASGQREQAAKEYMDLLTIEPPDEEVLNKLRAMGYAEADLPRLRAGAKLKEVRRKLEKKQQELRDAEEALLQATSKVQDARKGQGEDTRKALQAVEEETEKMTQKLVEEYQQWQSGGKDKVFKRVAQSLKKEADEIIATNEYGDINKSMKAAEKILASTDRVFQKEWQQANEKREKEFHEEFEDLKRNKETKLRSTMQEVLASAEQDKSAADEALKEVRAEVQALEKELWERKKPVFDEAPRQALLKDDTLWRGVISAPEQPPEEAIAKLAARRHAKDEVGKTLGTILVRLGVVSPQHLEEAIEKQKKDHRPVGQILVESGNASEEDIINALVAQAGVPYLPLANYEVGDDVAMTIPKELALRYALMPVDRIGTSLLVSMGIPLNKEQKEEVHQHARGMKITYFISSWSDIKAKHEQHYA